jgi:23S rRNA pseudouridine1911/1915/1917 synthase
MDLFYIVQEEHAGNRLDKFLAIVDPNHSRTYFQKLIKNGQVLVNNEPAKPSTVVEEGDEIFVNTPPPQDWHIQPEDIPLDIIYEDEDLAVINKPAGMVVHPGAGVRSGTLVHAILFHIKNLSSIGGIVRPGIVHRLDKNTSGLLVIAKNDFTHRALQAQFRNRSISRQYIALVWGHFQEQEGKIEGNIDRSRKDRKKMAVRPDGKEAITLYKVLNEYPHLSLLELKLMTGRTHQIRVHLKYIHHPVFGDPDYSGRESQLKGISQPFQREYKQLLNMVPYQFLHARQLEFIHPVQKSKMIFEAPLPTELETILQKLEQFKK